MGLEPRKFHALTIACGDSILAAVATAVDMDAVGARRDVDGELSSMDILALSMTSLGKVWDGDEEDRAWAHL